MGHRGKVAIVIRKVFICGLNQFTLLSKFDFEKMPILNVTNQSDFLTPFHSCQCRKD